MMATHIVDDTSSIAKRQLEIKAEEKQARIDYLSTLDGEALDKAAERYDLIRVLGEGDRAFRHRIIAGMK